MSLISLESLLGQTIRPMKLAIPTSVCREDSNCLLEMGVQRAQRSLGLPPRSGEMGPVQRAPWPAQGAQGVAVWRRKPAWLGSRCIWGWQRTQHCGKWRGWGTQDRRGGCLGQQLPGDSNLSPSLRSQPEDRIIYFIIQTRNGQKSSQNCVCWWVAFLICGRA